MKTDRYPVGGPWRGRLSVMPRPRGGDWLEDEVRAWSDGGIDTVVSLLTAGEVRELELDDEEKLSHAANIHFVSFPVEDRDVPPSAAEFGRLLDDLTASLAAGSNVAVHCRQGIGRAGLVAVGLLVRTGMTPEDAMRRVGESRGRRVPETPEQQRWIEHFALAPTAAE